MGPFFSSSAWVDFELWRVCLVRMPTTKGSRGACPNISRITTELPAAWALFVAGRPLREGGDRGRRRASELTPLFVPFHGLTHAFHRTSPYPPLRGNRIDKKSR